MNNTPQTDDIARGNHVVPTEWAQQLERERDEARNKMADALMEVDLRTLDFERMRQERDDARNELKIALEQWELCLEQITKLKNEKN